MEKLFEKYSIGQLLRYFVAGSVFIFSYTYSRSPVHFANRIFTLSTISPLGFALLSLTIGAFIYAVHRSLLNPALEKARIYVSCRLNKKWFCTSDLLIDRTIERWNADGGHRKCIQHFYEWGDYVQLLYSSGLAMAVGSISWFVLDIHSRNVILFKWFEPGDLMVAMMLTMAIVLTAVCYSKVIAGSRLLAVAIIAYLCVLVICGVVLSFRYFSTVIAMMSLLILAVAFYNDVRKYYYESKIFGYDAFDRLP